MNLFPACVVPTWHAPHAQEQYAETRSAGSAARYADRANRASAPTQQNNLAQGFVQGNSEEYFDNSFNYFWLFRTRTPVLRRQDFL